MALLLGLAPTPYLNGFSSISQAHQIMFARTQAAEGNSHERLVWRLTPALSALLHFDAVELTQLLCNVHYKLFRVEDAAATRSRLQSSDGSGLQALMRSVSNIVCTAVQRLPRCSLRSGRRSFLQCWSAWPATSGS
ncbi:hypothetical protein AURDEDRAFT_113489 [Auricularia subglabra TFB-10046 SS5]|nr:hypothetical protein AURDEDRAFT_113489 [Auricularia subglabra TFB-10046 SS5]